MTTVLDLAFPLATVKGRALFNQAWPLCQGKSEVMKSIITTIILWATALALAHASCPGCATNLPQGLPTDTIFLTAAPDGQAGAYYAEDLSFRMPKTTTPVNASDPETPAGLPISTITITSVTNVPPGLEWEASQLEFEVDSETDGCVRFCGTPLIPGYYEVQVLIEAQVLFATRSSSIRVPILILPGQAVAEGFTIDNVSGCGSVTASFTNNLPSGGQEGYSYEWNFGNGQAATSENPPAQEYDVPGIYNISYQAIIDTFGHLLTQVTVTEANCNDIFGGAPDLVLEIYNPEGTRIFSSPDIQNANLPVVYEPDVFLEPGTYTVRLIDDDQGLDGADDLCGEFLLTQNSSGLLTGGGSVISPVILHPVDTIRSFGQVEVFPVPAVPILDGIPTGGLCEGDSLLLTSEPAFEMQWYRDSMALPGATFPELLVGESGSYQLQVANVFGCSAWSAALGMSFAPLPAFPVFENEQNLLTLLGSTPLPQWYSLQWWQDGSPLPGATEEAYCISESGTYELVLTDLSSGCSRSYAQAQTYDPDFPDCKPLTDVRTEDVAAPVLYPNPGRSAAGLYLRHAFEGELGLTVLDASGRRLSHTAFEQVSAGDLLLPFIPEAPGFYVLLLQPAQGPLYRLPFSLF